MTKSRNLPIGTKGKHTTPRITSPARQKALAEGRKTYRSRAPCPRGHVGLRRVLNGNCVKCHRAARAENVEHYRKTHTAWRRKNPEKILAYHWRAVGITLPKVTRPRPTACECCGEKHKNRELSLDHDHKTGLFRGWLCHWCNFAMGWLRDDPARATLAARYLRKNSP